MGLVVDNVDPLRHDLVVPCVWSCCGFELRICGHDGALDGVWSIGCLVGLGRYSC